MTEQENKIRYHIKRTPDIYKEEKEISENARERAHKKRGKCVTDPCLIREPFDAKTSREARGRGCTFELKEGGGGCTHFSVPAMNGAI